MPTTPHLTPQPAPDAEEAAWQELKALLLARIRSGLAGNVSSKSVDDILHEDFGETPS
ncbi:MAG: hypothetical protein II058_06850 [Rhodocyclaceae bacterium]|nr:hypothetical protein [Rhodocyclaceae bacterium]